MVEVRLNIAQTKLKLYRLFYNLKIKYFIYRFLIVLIIVYPFIFVYQHSSNTKLKLLHSKQPIIPTSAIEVNHDQEYKDYQQRYLKPNYEYTDLLIIVRSDKLNFINRKNIRESFGSIRYYKDLIVKVLFYVPKSYRNDKDISKKFYDEYISSWDMYISDYPYSEVNYKSIYYEIASIFMSYKDAKKLFVIYDGHFINLPFTVKLMDTFEHNNKTLPVDLMCKIHMKNPVIRNKRDRYYVSVKDFSEKQYPPHCINDSPLIMSRRYIKGILKTRNESTKIWMSDVYLFGIQAKKMNITLANMQDIIPIGNMQPHMVRLDKIKYGILNNDEQLSKRMWRNIFINMLINE